MPPSDSPRRVVGKLTTNEPPVREGAVYEVLREFALGGKRFFRLRTVTGERFTAAAMLFYEA
jgi:hypothetical protein